MGSYQLPPVSLWRLWPLLFRSWSSKLWPRHSEKTHLWHTAGTWSHRCPSCRRLRPPSHTGTGQRDQTQSFSAWETSSSPVCAMYRQAPPVRSVLFGLWRVSSSSPGPSKSPQHRKRPTLTQTPVTPPENDLFICLLLILFFLTHCNSSHLWNGPSPPLLERGVSNSNLRLAWLG